MAHLAGSVYASETNCYCNGGAHVDAIGGAIGGGVALSAPRAERCPSGVASHTTGACLALKSGKNFERGTSAERRDFTRKKMAFPHEAHPLQIPACLPLSPCTFGRRRPSRPFTPPPPRRRTLNYTRRVRGPHRELWPRPPPQSLSLPRNYFKPRNIQARRPRIARHGPLLNVVRAASPVDAVRITHRPAGAAGGVPGGKF